MSAPATPMLLRLCAIAAGPPLALLVYALLSGSGLAHEPRAVAGIGVWMALWWMTEAVPLAVTSLLPIVLFPMTGVMVIRDAGVPYAHPLVLLFMSGFILGLAVERWGLHRRVALATVLVVGTRPRRLIGGFMLATAALSLFISNTATAIMMVPIAMSVIRLLDRPDQAEDGVGANFAPALLLSIAYAASIGGVTTMTSTQANMLLVGFLADRGVRISWAQWLPLGASLLVIMLPAAWLILTRITMPVGDKPNPRVAGLIRRDLRGLGRIGRGEWIVMVVLTLVALGWMTRGFVTARLENAGLEWLATRLTMLDDAGIGVVGAIALFMIPVSLKERQFAMDWKTASAMPWEVLLLFGGGLSLAAAMASTGLDRAIGGSLSGLQGVHPFLLVLIVAAMVTFLTELTSNTATAAALVPIMGAAAVALGVHPALLMLPAGIMASYSFMLPVATPPNAIVFGSGRLRIRQMVRAGFLLSMTSVVVVTLVVTQLAGPLLGIDMSVLPEPPGHTGLP